MIEKSAGAIIFRKEKDKTYYLLLSYSAMSKIEKTYWGLPKGRIEKGEKIIEAAKREVKEETGLEDIQLIKGFKETEKYFFKFQGKSVLKSIIFYLAETKTQKIKLSFEHIEYKWLIYEEAIKQLTFKETKEILKKANNFLLSFSKKIPCIK